MTLQSFIPAIQLSVRAALAAGLSVAIAQALHMRHPLYAMISAVLVMDLSPAQTRTLALPRFAGTLIGAATGAVLASFMRGSPLEVGIGILVTMIVTHLLRLHDAARLAGFLCGIILLNHSDAPWTYAYHRLLETALGIALAVIVSVVPKVISSPE